MTRERFSQQVMDVKHKVVRMGALVEDIIELAVLSLKDQDLEAAKKVCTDDDKIDEIELEIEMECMRMLALQQPLAKDLRTIATALKIITDLERMGDNAVNIAKITLEIGREPLIKPLIDIPQMAEIAQNMIKLSLDAFVREDVELAEKVAAMDEEVDTIYLRIVEDIIKLISDNKDMIRQGTKLMFIGRFLERIADHTTNICERVIFMATGELKEIN